MYYSVTQTTELANGKPILIAVFLMGSDAEKFIESISRHSAPGTYKVTEISDSKYSAFVSMHPKNDKESI